MIREYYQLIKPGIVYGNALTALAAFSFATQQMLNFHLLAVMELGLACSIAAACVVNNVIDRDIDTYMERTRNRPIPNGRISIRAALWFAAVLGIIGFGTLLLFTNLLTLIITWAAVFVYVALYTPLKRVSVHSTIVGAIAGAAPPVVGYVAATSQVDVVALCLFFILLSWQMTHFFAIAIYRLQDYTAARIPVLPVQIGVPRTKIAMLAYAGIFALALYALSLVSIVSPYFIYPVGTLAFGWFALTVAGFFIQNERRWARTVFFYSIILLLTFSVALALA